jgi:hypothetical protein
MRYEGLPYRIGRYRARTAAKASCHLIGTHI